MKIFLLKYINILILNIYLYISSSIPFTRCNIYKTPQMFEGSLNVVISNDGGSSVAYKNLLFVIAETSYWCTVLLLFSPHKSIFGVF